ncbi:MAG: hypothetical protein FJ109_18790 [Deltaproteobacteria bacterium]|nr:hypothetical protein [Deltaproteobacteria bacterium]
MALALSILLLAWPTVETGPLDSTSAIPACCGRPPPAGAAPAESDYDAAVDADADAAGAEKECRKLDADDPALAEVLEQAEIVGKVSRLTGGNMIKYVFRLKDGSPEGLKVVFKPAQVGDWGDWKNEIAAYRIDQALGFRLVPATARRELPFSLFDLSDPKVAAALRPDALEPPGPDETVEGALQVWVPSSHVAEEGEGRAWAEKMLTELGTTAGDLEDRVTAAVFVRLVIFDFLLSNPDRYSGGNMLRDSGGRYWAIDNAGAFVGCVRPKTDLLKLRRFEKVAVERLKKLDRKTLRTQLKGLLTDGRFRTFWKRRREVLERVRELSSKLGKSKVLF